MYILFIPLPEGSALHCAVRKYFVPLLNMSFLESFAITLCIYLSEKNDFGNNRRKLLVASHF